MKLIDVDADESSFALRDLLGQDIWQKFTPVFGSLTVVGATAYNGRLRFVGRQCFAQVQFSAATSVASTSGTTYLTLPAAAQGLAAPVQMVNLTSKVEVPGARIIVSEGKLYLPAIVATADVFALSFWFES